MADHRLPGGARAKGHPALGLEHPGRGWSQPLGAGSKGRTLKHGGGPPDWSIRGKWPNRAPGIVEQRHARKAGAGLVPLERGYERQRSQGSAKSIGRRGSEHRGKNGGEKKGRVNKGVGGGPEGAQAAVR